MKIDEKISIDMIGTDCIVFVGPNNVGKGTQVLLLEERLSGIPIGSLTTSKVLRHVTAHDSGLSKIISEAQELGELVSDPVVLESIISFLKDEHLDKAMLMLDGFPRTELQAAALWGIVQNHFRRPVRITVVALEVGWEEILRRRQQRVDDANAAGLPQRIDDALDVVKKRFDAHMQTYEAVLQICAIFANVVRIDASGSKEQTHDSIIERLLSKRSA